MNHLHGTCRGLIPSKPLAPLSHLDGIGNKFNRCLAGVLANRTWSWKLRVVSQSSVNCTSSKRNDLISPLQFPPSAATASKLMLLCSERDLWGLVFSQTSELLTPVSAVQVLELAPQRGKKRVAGRERDFSAAEKTYISFSQQWNTIISLKSLGNQAKN